MVKTSVHLGHCSRSQIWAVLVDFERYPALMEDVVSVRIDSRSDQDLVSTWNVLLNGSQMTWTERDVLITEQNIRFEQIDGDLEVWHGSWAISEHPDGLYVDLEVNFDIGIPSLAELLHPIGVRAIQANSRQMLDAIRDTVLMFPSS